jgi:membrane-bound metal-dependent hydrolase YbcI (DUF457 family)
MPSPIAHLGVGYAIYRYYKHQLPQDQRHLWKFPLQIVMVAGLSMLPDLDVIPAIIFRDMKTYHNSFSNSLFVAVPIAILIAGVFHRIYRSNFWMWFLICLLSYDFHIIMDALTAERGVMIFWPLSQSRFVSPIRIFYGLKWGLGWFRIWHLWTAFTESVFVLVLMVVVSYFNNRKAARDAVLPQVS